MTWSAANSRSRGRLPDGDRDDATALVADAHDFRLGEGRNAALGEPIAAALPHHARTEARIVEPVDQGGDHLAVLAARAQQRALDRLLQVEVLDALARPLGADLRAGHAPHLLGVGLEEDLVEAAAEPVDHPVLEGALVADGSEPRRRVAHADAGGLERPQAEQRVDRPERVVEEAAAVVDARHAIALEEVLAEQLVPHLANARDLGEEAVAADVEAVAAVVDGARDAADDRVLLEHHRVVPEAGQLPGRGQPAGPGADHHREAHWFWSREGRPWGRVDSGRGW